jgi:ubiquitin-protein ligase
MDIATKRLVKDINILKYNQDDLNKRGIYFAVDESNMFNINFLIIPRHKEDGNLASPYTNGLFLFKLEIPNDFPVSPPKTTFYPQQNVCRLHPNYYEGGKICLSIINTWASDDWSPSMSLLALANVLEERFNERALSFEPGHEVETMSNYQKFNHIVRFGVYQVAICNVLENKYKEYEPFNTTIKAYWNMQKNAIIQDVKSLLVKHPFALFQTQPFYPHVVKIDYKPILERLEAILI